jgi:tRNA threonylcarbamoyladenosine biosynthesis protein TsaE
LATIISRSAEETLAFGRRVADAVSAGDVLALVGELGAGKTQFAKGVAAGLGHQSEVTSPTFTLVHEYTGGRLPLYHFDFYRLDAEEEAWQIGFDDYLSSGGVVAIEWANKFPALLPKTARWFEFTIAADDSRQIRETGDRLLTNPERRAGG